MNLVHICNPENRRAHYLREACRKLSLPAPKEIAWIDFLSEDDHPDLAPGYVVRIESPGESFAVEKRLIEKGGGPANLTEDHGRLRHQVNWYCGLQKTLREIEKTEPNASFINHPSAIEIMFDKYRSQTHLATHGIPIPNILGRIDSFDQLLSLMEEKSTRRVFLKPCHSSSASGVVALQTSIRGRFLATTSSELVGTRIYNSLKLRQYSDRDEIRKLIDLLCRENLMAEKWFPKASLNGKIYDLRVVVIAGEARHAVARTSRSPITNLHLGNARGDIESIRQALGNEVWQSAMKVCENTSACFPDCHYVAVDLMISAGQTGFAVAEVNAFGDLIPNIYSGGDDTYTAELRSFIHAQGSRSSSNQQSA
ncbi:MAG: STM4014 family protein [Verrucomicrobiales bacterium]|nr:STM4014 family protein [Verrucomicrobiales bacterium]